MGRAYQTLPAAPREDRLRLAHEGRVDHLRSKAHNSCFAAFAPSRHDRVGMRQILFRRCISLIRGRHLCWVNAQCPGQPH